MLSPEVALYVPSPKLFGKPQMVGRFLHDQIGYDWVLWHEPGPTETGLEIANDIHGGIDTATVDFLRRQDGYGAIAVHHKQDPDNQQYVVALAYFIRHAKLFIEAGRYRYFLDQRLWAVIPTVVASNFLPRFDLSLVPVPQEVAVQLA